MNNRGRKSLIKAGWLLFYLYIIALSYFLFFSERYGRGLISENYRYNLELLKEIKRFIKYRDYIGYENFIINILGNIFAFVPYGFLLPALKHRYRKFRWIFFAVVLFTVSIELIQLVFKVGIFDVDDLLLNTIGGLMGFCLFWVIRFIFYKGIGKGKAS